MIFHSLFRHSRCCFFLKKNAYIWIFEYTSKQIVENLSLSQCQISSKLVELNTHETITTVQTGFRFYSVSINLLIIIKNACKQFATFIQSQEIILRTWKALVCHCSLGLLKQLKMKDNNRANTPMNRACRFKCHSLELFEQR